jgi:hypothetical protein
MENNATGIEKQQGTSGSVKQEKRRLSPALLLSARNDFSPIF